MRRWSGQEAQGKEEKSGRTGKDEKVEWTGRTRIWRGGKRRWRLRGLGKDEKIEKNEKMERNREG